MMNVKNERLFKSIEESVKQPNKKTLRAIQVTPLLQP
ncbi:MAG: hypothetical protein UV38_C0001G0033 [candidate division TM6 bacterium GW2011_GWE2_42_60]|nr:MAG: hypothetical protein UV38_C0001G0033 [candidate division TM6 bacterium GW2011_GWE2_42_60]